MALLGCPTGTTEPEEEKPETPASAKPASPEAPALQVGEQRLTVTWAPVNGAASYGVQWSPAADGKTNKDDITGTSYVITGLTNGTKYTVWVRAKNTAGTSEYGPSAQAIPVAAAKVPDAPALAPGVSVSGDTITVTWNEDPDAVKYQVWYGTDKASSNAKQFGTDHSASPVSFSVAENGTYYVWIKAGNSRGYSGFSPASASVTVSGVVSVVGTWKRDNSTTTYTLYTFAADGTMMLTYTDDDEGASGTGKYYYDSATKKIYSNSAKTNEWGYYTIANGKLTITRLYSSNYKRTAGTSGLTGTWRSSGSGSSYHYDITFTSATVREIYVDDGETYYDYTSPLSTKPENKLSWRSLVAELKNGKLVYEGVSFTRSGSGSGVIGTWTYTTTGNDATGYPAGVTVTFVVTATTATLTETYNGETETEEASIEIVGNAVCALSEYIYSIDISKTPHVLTLTQESSYTCTRQ